MKKRDEELSGRLSMASLRRAKDKGEIVLLKSKLADAEEHMGTRIEEVIAEARDEAARGSAKRTREVAGLLGRIGGAAKDNMLDLAEIDAGLEFIERLRRPDAPTLETEEELLVERKVPIYDARDMFDELVSSVRRALEISEDDGADDEGADEEIDE